MDSVLTRVSEGLERGSAALGGIINDIQYTGQVSGDRDIGSQVSRGLDSLLGPRGGPGSLLLSPGHPAWRQLSLFSVWTALKVTVNKNNNKAVSNSDVQVYSHSPCCPSLTMLTGCVAGHAGPVLPQHPA